MVQLCKNDVLVTPQHINIKKTVFFYFDEKQITERHMLHIKKKPDIEFLQTHLVKIWATLLPSWFTQLMSKKMNCTVRDWTSSAKLSSLQGICYLGASFDCINAILGITLHSNIVYIQLTCQDNCPVNCKEDCSKQL